LAKTKRIKYKKAYKYQLIKYLLTALYLLFLIFIFTIFTSHDEIKTIVSLNLQKGLWLNNAVIFPKLNFWLIIRSLHNNNSF